jgi:hypothetical protein
MEEAGILLHQRKHGRHCGSIDIGQQHLYDARFTGTRGDVVSVTVKGFVIKVTMGIYYQSYELKVKS